MYVGGHVVTNEPSNKYVNYTYLSIAYVVYWLLLSQYRERKSIRSQFPFIFESIPQTIEYLKMLRYSSSVTMNGAHFIDGLCFTIYMGWRHCV